MSIATSISLRQSLSRIRSILPDTGRPVPCALRSGGYAGSKRRWRGREQAGPGPTPPSKPGTTHGCRAGREDRPMRRRPAVPAGDGSGRAVTGVFGRVAAAFPGTGISEQNPVTPAYPTRDCPPRISGKVPFLKATPGTTMWLARQGQAFPPQMRHDRGLESRPRPRADSPGHQPHGWASLTCSSDREASNPLERQPRGSSGVECVPAVLQVRRATAAGREASRVCPLGSEDPSSLAGGKSAAGARPPPHPGDGSRPRLGDAVGGRSGLATRLEADRRSTIARPKDPQARGAYAAWEYEGIEREAVSPALRSRDGTRSLHRTATGSSTRCPAALAIPRRSSN